MEKERLESLLIDYLDGRLNAVDKHIVEGELASNPHARKLLEELKEVIAVIRLSSPLQPTPGLKENFQRHLDTSIVTSPRAKTISFTPRLYRVAAAVALLIVGGALGFWINTNSAQDDRFAQIEEEMKATREQLAETKRAMLSLLGNDQSASQRIKGVNVAMQLRNADSDVVDALFETLHSDPNTNVRLAALEALARFHNDGFVRKGLISSLKKQTDPMVQIRLIQLMVEMQEKQVVDDLQKIVDDAGLMKAVKDEAHSGILKLS